MSKLQREIESFQSIWKGGFRDGHPWCLKRNVRGLKKYIEENMKGKCCLEIGCGGGDWSKFIYDLNIFDKIYCIDVLSEEHNKFWSHVGDEKKDKIEYIHVKDFTLDFLPLNTLDYVFSYDVFCHISYSGQKQYISNLYNKCKVDCELLIMYSDPRKYLKSEPENLFHVKMYIPGGGKNCSNNEELIQQCLDDKDGEPQSGRSYWVGMDAFTELCTQNNYEILDRDLNIDKTNPITLFKKTKKDCYWTEKWQDNTNNIPNTNNTENIDNKIRVIDNRLNKIELILQKIIEKM